MKTHHLIIILLCLILMIIASCNRPVIEGPEQLEISGELISNTECKYLKAASEDETPDSLSCAEYSYDPSTKILSLKHINAGFNCCPGELSSTITTAGDTIIIMEREEIPQCHCLCLYDLDIKIEGVLEQPYQLIFDEEYVDTEPELNFSINLKNKSEGKICVVRKNYPWGLISTQE